MITCRLCIPTYAGFEDAKKCWQKLFLYGKFIRHDVYQYQGIEFHIEPRGGALIHDARNDLITDHSITGNTVPLPFDFFHFIDSDVMCTHDIDDVVRLISHDKDIVGGAYWDHDGSGMLIKMKNKELKSKSDLQKVAELATGFLCIKRKVFMETEGPWFWHPKVPGQWKPAPESRNFCNYVSDKFDIWVDWKIELKHGERPSINFNTKLPSTKGSQMNQQNKQPEEKGEPLTAEKVDSLILRAQNSTSGVFNNLGSKIKALLDLVQKLGKENIDLKKKVERLTSKKKPVRGKK